MKTWKLLSKFDDAKIHSYQCKLMGIYIPLKQLQQTLITFWEIQALKVCS